MKTYEDLRKELKHESLRASFITGIHKEVAKLLGKSVSYLQRIRNEDMLKESPENTKVLKKLIKYYKKRIDEELVSITGL